jgi:biopolymer transport protein ExbD
MGPPDSVFLRLRGEINVTPLIDVLLVLFVVFLLAQQTRMVTPVQLPPPREREGAAPLSPQIVLQLGEDGSYAINGRAVPLELLGRRLSELYFERPVKLIFVQAAPGRRYGEVIDAVDLARGAGVQVVGFAPYPQAPTRGDGDTMPESAAEGAVRPSR